MSNVKVPSEAASLSKVTSSIPCPGLPFANPNLPPSQAQTIMSPIPADSEASPLASALLVTAGKYSE